MSRFGSTITAAPKFGFEMAMRRSPSPDVNLRPLRACITGAEPIKAATLRGFASTFAQAGFSPLAFCPAYGVAECTLAVCATPTETSWSSIALDPGELASGRYFESSSGTELVVSGQPLRDIEVSIEGSPGEVGEILVRGQSIGQSYADGRPILDEEGWFRTQDLGFFTPNGLIVVGRKDDVFHVAARNIYALDVEHCVGEINGLRAGRIVAVAFREQLVVVAESEARSPDRSEVSQLVATIRLSVVRRIGVSPRGIAIVPRGQLPMTSSGKTQRNAVVSLLAEDRLVALAGSKLD